MDCFGGKNGCQTLGPECDSTERVVIWKGSHDHIATGKIAEPVRRCCADRPQRYCPLAVGVKDEHLIAVFEKVGRQGVSHIS